MLRMQRKLNTAKKTALMILLKAVGVRIQKIRNPVHAHRWLPLTSSVERIEDFCDQNPVQYFQCVIQSNYNRVAPGTELGECQGGHCHPKIFPGPPSGPPKIFQVSF